MIIMMSTQVSLAFLNIWHQKQCMCVFRDVKNLERFSLGGYCFQYYVVKMLIHFLIYSVVQCITKIALKKLKDLPKYLNKLFGDSSKNEEVRKEGKDPGGEEKDKEPPEKSLNEEEADGGEGAGEEEEEQWCLEDTERLLTYMSRVFMLQFPLYLAAKQVRIHLTRNNDNSELIE